MEHITLGLPATLTGRYALMGKESLKGILLWLDDVNSRGGIYLNESSGRVPVALKYLDNESSTEKTSEITEKLIKDKNVNILLGPYSSSLTVAAARVAAMHDRTLWNYGGSTDEIYGNAFDNVISTITPASDYFKGVLDLMEEYSTSRELNLFIVFAHDSGFAKKVSDGLMEHAEGKKHAISQLYFQSGEQDFGNIIKEMESGKADIVFFVGRFEDDVRFASQAVKSSLKETRIALVAASIEEFRSELGENAEGFIATSQWEPGLNLTPDCGPIVQEFITGFENKYGNMPDYISAQSYNIGVLIEKTIRETNELDDKKLRNTAKNIEARTFYGDFSIDPETSRQTGHKMVVTQWQGGKKEIVFPREYSTSQLI